MSLKILWQCLLLIIVFTGAPLKAADLPFVNWENHPVHALDLSPDRKVLATTHTADQRIQLFDISSGEAISIGHILVGIDPVSVRFRTNNELWVVNHISDSISVIDIGRRQVIDTLSTQDEPFDLVFAGNRAFVTCSQTNEVMVFNVLNRASPAQIISIAGEDPRALAVSVDGQSVYVAVFESGNATTLLAGGLMGNQIGLPNVVSDSRGPYGGQNPPPNSGSVFDPPLNSTATPPRVGLIVRKGNDARWRDDNNRDWSEFVSGSLASASGRVQAWDLPDRDLAIIDTNNLSVRYVSGLMNIGMALAVNPSSGVITMVGTDAKNEIRFEPKLNGRFIRTQLASVSPDTLSKQISDLNSHLDYSGPRIAQNLRTLSISDPRAILWRADGERGFIAGMGSNHVVVIDRAMQRIGAPIAVGQGPVGIALDEARNRMYVWNHFDASLSTIDLVAGAEVRRLPVFNPLPQPIRAGRPLLYDSHRTSGLGQASCASCHVDARMDRLAWDLGDPSQAPAVFDQNCLTIIGSRPCENFHAMKGPMTTQTLQDIIGHEPFHWRGDRTGIEAFNPAFEHLLGDDQGLNASDMQAFENFLGTIAFVPNPFRNIDNSLPNEINLQGHYTSGRFAMAGLPLGNGNANRGLQLYTTGLLDTVFQCSSCHSLPTGMAANGPLFLGVLGVSVGGMRMPLGPMGENHLGIVSTDGSTNVSIKVPHLRNQYDKVGFNLRRTDSLAGFGFLHDGSVDSISSFLSASTFSVRSDQEVADLVALMLSFAGSDFSGINPAIGAPVPLSRDTHAAVGKQLQVIAANASSSIFLALARSLKVDLIVQQNGLGRFFDASQNGFIAADGSIALTEASLLALANSNSPQTWTLVPKGLGQRLGIDRDADGIGDLVEVAQGSNPSDANSILPKLRSGLWFNPARSGHGIDLHFAAEQMVLTWYTYDDESNPTWYQAVGPVAQNWQAQLSRYTRNPSSGQVIASVVGNVKLITQDATHAQFEWQLGNQNGVELMQPLYTTATPTIFDRTGIWYDANEPGWGLSLYSEAEVSAAVVYFYDASNQPRWVLGTANNSANQNMEMRSYRGFCPSCPATTPSSVSSGTVDLSLAESRITRTRVAVRYNNESSSSWQRGPLTLTALSQPSLRLNQQ